MSYAVGQSNSRHSRESGNPVTEIANHVPDLRILKSMDSCFRRNDGFVISSA